MRRIPFFGMKVPIPNHPILRLIMGLILIIGGTLGFLPVLGFWMIPLGLVVLSIDFPTVRRFRRRSTVRLGLWMTGKYPKLAKSIGYSILRPSRR
jgi:purine-cytosine permease-like protein